jgi:hypothetical protein
MVGRGLIVEGSRIILDHRFSTERPAVACRTVDVQNKDFEHHRNVTKEE